MIYCRLFRPDLSTPNDLHTLDGVGGWKAYDLHDVFLGLGLCDSDPAPQIMTANLGSILSVCSRSLSVLFVTQ